MDEPAYRVWMQDSVPPQAAIRRAPGPLGGRAVLALARHRGAGCVLTPGRLTATPGAPEAGRDRGPHAAVPRHGRRLVVRLRAERRCALGPARRRRHGGLLRDRAAARAPGDPRRAGAHRRAVVSTGRTPCCARGSATSRRTAPRCASPTACSTSRIATSHEHPEPLEPGRRYAVRLQLNDAAHAFPAGHRIRLALSTTYWPIAWPSPEAATVTVSTGGSRLSLPIRRRTTRGRRAEAVCRRRKARRRSAGRPCARAASSAALPMTSPPTP